MARRLENARDDLIRRVLDLVKEKQSPKDAELIAKFAKPYYLTTSPEDLLEIDTLDLYGALISNWHFMYKRQPLESKVRIYNPDFEQHGWQSTHTVVEVIDHQKPFLFESIRMVLNQFGLNVHLILHLNHLPIVRNTAGEIVSIRGKSSDPNDTSAIESLIFIEIDRQSDPEYLQHIHDAIVDTIEDVTFAVNDWQAMKTSMQTVTETLEERFKKAPKRELHDEITAFLKWIYDDHFTFLGYCYRTLANKNDTYHWQLENDTCLGVLKHEGDNYFTPFSELSKAAQELAVSDFPIILGKTDRKAMIHRPAYTDFIVIKDFDDNGKVIGEHQFIGLYTSAAYNLSPLNIPLLRMRVHQILHRAHTSADSHDGKTLLNILETLPRDDFFHASVKELYELSMGILHLQERQRIRLFIRKDPFARLYSCLVFVPRERFNSRIREKIAEILQEELGGYQVDFEIRISESVLARIHYIVRFKDESARPYDIIKIQKQLIKISRTWADLLKNALLDHFGEGTGTQLFNGYRNAFPAGYRADFDVRTAVYDIQHMEMLSKDNPLEMSFYRPLDETEGLIRFKLYSPQVSIPLSDVIPILESMGLRVISERPHEILPSSGQPIWINDFGMIPNTDRELDVDTIKDIFQDAFFHIWYHYAESDGFNRLVLGANLTWREVTVLRAYAKYMWQIGFTFSQAYIEEVLSGVPEITANLVKLFKTRFSPKLTLEERVTKTDDIHAQINEELESVKNIDEDRIIRRYLHVMLATIRTNFYQNGEHDTKNYISFKLDPKHIPELPLPRPLYEVFVYSPRVEGVHLRGAKVARGGLRWSDRREDYRTEVLGLMKAQQVKNAVIVPLGAKGGFVPKNLAQQVGREQYMKEAIACYQIFIRGLLDITDNLVDKKVVKPEKVVRYDEDDTYLVVAADKGTATFSDIANEISIGYHFWLGDAFASGGSAGYDHKKMGITARGAWESVKQHFRELGLDTQKTEFSVVGIGDMSGDVFGNGMLLSHTIKLVGAFNHMHIFLDPNPDLQASYDERLRLFNLPRSSWEDYNQELISKGGGVFSRTQKFIPISEEMQKILNTTKTKMVPLELIRKLLKANVDLLFNGGIGTYVKATDEQDLAVGDRANDAIRVNGKDLNCRVIGEGGNLGMTQLGRIEFALNGGKINTDAIDNSGGVDCSDHEVNIKILLNAIIEAGDLTEKQRNELLIEMTEEITELVLENNRSQIEAISVAEFHAPKNAQMHCRLIEHLEKRAALSRKLEYLPSNEVLLARKQSGQGITRPELSVLLAYCKTLLKNEILGSNVPEDKWIERVMVTAFPDVLKERYGKQMYHHPLKREIIAMQISNTLINDMGLGAIHRLEDETGADIPEIIRGYFAAREIFRARRFREAVNALDFIVTAEIQVKMLHELNRLVRRGARWFIRHRENHKTEDIALLIEQFTPKMDEVKSGLKHALEGSAEEYLYGFARELMDENVPEEIALITAQMGAMFSALDIVDAAVSHDLPVEDVTITYYALGARLELGWFREEIKRHPVTSHWDSLARATIRDDLDRQQRNLTVSVMKGAAESTDIGENIEAWMKKRKHYVERWQHMLTDLKGMPKREFIMYSVALRELVELSETTELDKHRAA